MFLLQNEKLDTLKKKIHDLENENSELRYSNTKLEEEVKQLSSQFEVTNTEDSSTNPKFNIKIEKDSIGSNSPERFEMVDKNMSLFKQRDSIVTLDDNISNNSFNTNEWINLNIPQNTQIDHIPKKVDFENW